MMNELLRAALVVARTKCNNDTTDPEGCGEKWCTARSGVRAALNSMGVSWSEDAAAGGEEDGA